MKKVILLIGGVHQANASGFIKEFEKLGGSVDRIVCLQAPKTFFSTVKSGLRVLKKFNPQSLKGHLVNVYRVLTNSMHLKDVKKQWENAGENSWDLLEPGINFVEYASSRAIPFHFSSALTKVLMQKVAGSENCIVVLYAGGIISGELLAMSTLEFVNAHMGDMPRYRGMNVIEWAVLEDQPVKVSVMTMNKVIDGGDIIYTHDIPLTAEKSIKDLRRTGYVECYKAMAKGVFDYQRNLTTRRAQEKNPRYYYRMHTELRRMLNNKLQNNIK